MELESGARAELIKKGPRPGAGDGPGRAGVIRLVICSLIFAAAVAVSVWGGPVSVKLSDAVDYLNSGGEINEVFGAVGRLIAGKGSAREVMEALLPGERGPVTAGKDYTDVWEIVTVPGGISVKPYVGE